MRQKDAQTQLPIIWDIPYCLRLMKTIEGTDVSASPSVVIASRAKDAIGAPRKRLGVLQASFNPLTVAHVSLLEMAEASYHLDEIVLLPGKANADKGVLGVSLVDRLIMLSLFAQERPKMSVCLSNRGFFIDNARVIRSMYPEGTDIRFITGYDTIVRILDKEGKYFRHYYGDYNDRITPLRDFFSISRFIIANREGHDSDAINALFEEKEHRPYRDKIDVLELRPEYARVSSTEVRERIERGLPISHLTPPEIEAFVNETKMYGGGDYYRARQKSLVYFLELVARGIPAGQIKADFKRLVKVAAGRGGLGRRVKAYLQSAKMPVNLLDRPHLLYGSDRADAFDSMEEARPLQRDVVGDFNIINKPFNREEAVREANRCLLCPEPPCERKCATGTEIKRVLETVRRGNFKEAYELLREVNVLFGMTSYLCQSWEKYCQSGCTVEHLFGEGHHIAIQAIENAVWRYGFDLASDMGEFHQGRSESVRERVAIIGAGPAGLTAAAELAKLGYNVAVFDLQPEAGGVPRYETPLFRFPSEEVFPKILQDIAKLGVNIVTGLTVGISSTSPGADEFEKTKKTLADLKGEGYVAIFIATGLTKAKRLGIAGEELKGVTTSIDLFNSFGHSAMKIARKEKALARLKQKYNGKVVYVVEGGNTAMDASRMLKRLGANVTIIYWRDRPRALPKETAAAEREGVQFLLLARPIRFIGDRNGHVKAIEAVRTTYKDGVDVMIEGSQFEIATDFVVYAIGADPDFRDEGLTYTSDGHIVVNGQTLETAVQGVFAGGDVVESGNVCTAIRDGKLAARSIDAYVSERR